MGRFKVGEWIRVSQYGPWEKQIKGWINGLSHKSYQITDVEKKDGSHGWQTYYKVRLLHETNSNVYEWIPESEAARGQIEAPREVEMFKIGGQSVPKVETRVWFVMNDGVQKATIENYTVCKWGISVTLVNEEWKMTTTLEDLNDVWFLDESAAWERFGENRKGRKLI